MCGCNRKKMNIIRNRINQQNVQRLKQLNNQNNALAVNNVPNTPIIRPVARQNSFRLLNSRLPHSMRMKSRF
jgi:hypothetical protein